MRASGRRILIRALLALGVYTLAVDADTPSLEYKVKASFLYNFLQFIDWPSDAFNNDQFNFCVIGAAHFGTALDDIAGDYIEGQKIVVHPLKDAAKARAKHCHLLFIAYDKPAAGVTVERGMLVIGESPDILKRGGAIRLIERNGDIRFQINPKAAHDAGLSLSSRLLDLAIQDDNGKQRDDPREQNTPRPSLTP